MKRFGYIYIGRAENDKDGDVIFTKSGLTVNPVNRLINYQTNKCLYPFKYHKVYKIPLTVMESAEEYFHKHVTKHLTCKVVHGVKSAGTETRVATPEQLDELLLKMFNEYKIDYTDVSTQLDKLQVEKVKKEKKTKPTKMMPKTITKIDKTRNYQNDILNDIDQCQENGFDRGQISLPTGSGKSIVIIQQMQKYLCSDTKICIFTEKKALVYQFYKDIRSFIGKDVYIIINASLDNGYDDDCNVLVYPDKKSLTSQVSVKNKVIVISTYNSAKKLIHTKKYNF